MSTANALIMLCFVLLMIPPRSRKAAFCYLVFYSLYVNWVVPISSPEPHGKYYYMVTAAMDLMVGFILISKYFAIGTLSFVLIFVNAFGWMLWENYYPPTLYDNIAKSIIIAQIVLLTIRGFNGLNHIYIQFPYGSWLVRVANAYGREALSLLFKSKASQ